MLLDLPRDGACQNRLHSADRSLAEQRKVGAYEGQERDHLDLADHPWIAATWRSA